MAAINYKPLDKIDSKIITTLAKNNMKMTETSYDLNVHRNTIVYRVEKIKQLTGLDPLNFYNLVELLRMVNDNA